MVSLPILPPPYSDPLFLNTSPKRRAYKRHLMKIDPHCFYCRKRIQQHATLDHLTPQVRGGQHVVENLVLACRFCNCFKGSKTLLEMLEMWQAACVKLELIPA